ncbi:uncharacterized protein TNCV_2724841 [Trichonephila clavipes]|nr:uncharacterized protein TNCV_2724841 [Trichonephila clavipes]
MMTAVPSGHGHEFVASVSCVRAVMPLKAHRVERLMHVQTVHAQTHFIDVVWKFGEADWNRGKHNGVADAVGVARSVVARLWNRLQETGNVRRRPGAGWPRATTSTDDRYIQLTARRNRTENATQLQRQLLLATGRRVSSQTVRNRLHEGGSMHVGQWFAFRAPVRPGRRWAAERRLGAT